jgi:hypothetical protein
MTLLSNDWWVWVWNTFSISILWFPTLATFILKLWAIFNPRIPSNQVSDLIKDFWPKANMDRTTTVSSSTVTQEVNTTRGIEDDALLR